MHVQLPRWACTLFGTQVPARPVVRHAGPPGAAQHAAQQQQQHPAAAQQVGCHLAWKSLDGDVSTPPSMSTWQSLAAHAASTVMYAGDGADSPTVVTGMICALFGTRIFRTGHSHRFAQRKFIFLQLSRSCRRNFRRVICSPFLPDFSDAFSPNMA